MPQLNKQPKSEKKSASQKKIKYYEAVGRRKTATARVRLYLLGKKDKREIIVNDKPIEEYFPGKIAKTIYIEPFRTTNTLNRFKTKIKVSGSGKKAQLEAVIHGLSRALVRFDEEKFRQILRKKGFLTRDARAKERRKPGLAQKARKRKQSPKR